MGVRSYRFCAARRGLDALNLYLEEVTFDAAWQLAGDGNGMRGELDNADCGDGGVAILLSMSAADHRDEQEASQEIGPRACRCKGDAHRCFFLAVHLCGEIEGGKHMGFSNAHAKTDHACCRMRYDMQIVALLSAVCGGCVEAGD